MTDYAPDPVHDEDRHTADLEADEARFDRQKLDYLMAYATQINPVSKLPEVYQDFDDWAVTITPRDKDMIIKCLQNGHLEVLRYYVGGMFVDYMDELAAIAVRERKG